MKNIAVIFGGKSAEHEISVLSARNIMEAIDRGSYHVHPVVISKTGSWYLLNDVKHLLSEKSFTDEVCQRSGSQIILGCSEDKSFILDLKTQKRQPVDVAFPVLHGTFGEDGTIQGYFKMMNLPFVGCGVFGSAACMDKEKMKSLLVDAKIPVAPWVVLKKSKPISFDALTKQLGSPFFIKPSSAGSSVGVHKIRTADEYKKKLEDAFQYDHTVLAEKFIEGREIECSVLGLNQSAKASLAGEIIPTHDFYSYEAKYLDANGAKLSIPAELKPEELHKIQQYSILAFEKMGCDGISRVDFFLQKNGDIYLNELNTLPGFTNISMYPKMWEATGISYKDLISKLIDLAFEKFELDNSLKTDFA